MDRAPAAMTVIHHRSSRLLRLRAGAHGAAGQRGRGAGRRSASACSRCCAVSRSPARRSATSARPAAPAPTWSASGRSGAFFVINVAAVALMELIGVQRRRGRDLATGIVLGAGLGLAALFLYLDATHQSTTGAAVTVLFGSLFSVSSTTIPLAIAVAAVVLALVALAAGHCCWRRPTPSWPRPAGSRCVWSAMSICWRCRWRWRCARVTIGSILSTALLIGPAASAMRNSRRPVRAIAAAAGAGDRGGVDRRPVGLRQLRMAAAPSGMAGQLLRGRARAS